MANTEGRLVDNERFYCDTESCTDFTEIMSRPGSIDFEEAKALSVAAGKVLQPRTPITSRELFAGRWNQLTAVADAVVQPGLHVAIYGALCPTWPSNTFRSNGPRREPTRVCMSTMLTDDYF